MCLGCCRLHSPVGERPWVPPEKWALGCVAVLMIALRGQQQPHGTVRDPHLSRTAIAELGCGFSSVGKQ